MIWLAALAVLAAGLALAAGGAWVARLQYRDTMRLDTIAGRMRRRFGRDAYLIGLALVPALQKAIEAFADYEDAMARARAVTEAETRRQDLLREARIQLWAREQLRASEDRLRFRDLST